MKSKLLYTAPVVLAVALAVYVLAGSPKPPKDRLSLGEAEEIALATYDGKIESHELEEEKGTWVYSFDLRGEDKQLHEVLVDARTGNVVSHTVETATQEAQEAAADKQNKK
jgi:hypothetical protein